MATTPEEIKSALRGRNNTASRRRLGANNQRAQGGQGNTQAAFTANPTGSQVSNDVTQPTQPAAPQNAPTTLGSVDLNIPEPTEVGLQGATQPGAISNDGNTVTFDNLGGGTATISGDNVASRLGDGGGTVSGFDSQTFTASAQDRTDLAETRAAAAQGFSSVEAFRASRSGQSTRDQQARINLGEQRILARRDAKEQQERLDRRIGDLQDKDRRRGFSTSTSSKAIDGLLKQRGNIGAKASEFDAQLTGGATEAAQKSATLAEQQRANNLSAQNRLLTSTAQSTQAAQKREDTLAQQGQTNSLANRRLELQQAKAVNKELANDEPGVTTQQKIANAVNVGGIARTIQAVPEAQAAIQRATDAGRTPQATTQLLKELTNLGFNQSQLVALGKQTGI